VRSSPAAMSMIVFFEVSSEETYNKLYRPPTWPGGASGVTIGIGYDCGFETAAQIASDWGQYLTADMISKLGAAAGMTGARAQVETHKIRNAVSVSWTAAMAVFQNHDMPKWEALVEKALPNCDLLSGDSFGSLVSLAYNRGASFNGAGDRYLEMREIHANMADKNFAAIPGNIRSMQRLWPNVPGLQSRRRQEADLFEKGLREPIAEPAPVAVSVDPVPVPAPEAPPSPVPAPIHPKFSVAWVQASLNAISDEQISVDGQYGPGTIAAVKRFQAANGLAEDGIARLETLKTLAKRLDV
jgi:peptidoglycan hydrolase-like protein with peptidoglycan-binding domain